VFVDALSGLVIEVPFVFFSEQSEGSDELGERGRVGGWGEGAEGGGGLLVYFFRLFVL